MSDNNDSRKCRYCDIGAFELCRCHKPKMIIMRGLPGSGKTTIAKDLGADVICSADDYFTDSDGVYSFSPQRLKDAHENCQSRVKDALAQNLFVVVDNTHTRRWEMQPYIDMAKEYGIEPEIIIAKGEYQNIHGVPPEAIATMRERWED